MVLKDKANLSENVDQEAQTIGSYTSRAQEVQNGDDPFIPR